MDWLGHDQADSSLFPYPLSMTLFNKGQSQICNRIQEQQAGEGDEDTQSCRAAVKPSCLDATPHNEKERGCPNGPGHVRLGALRPESRPFPATKSLSLRLSAPLFTICQETGLEETDSVGFSSFETVTE